MPNRRYLDFKTVKASVSILEVLDRYGLTGRFKRTGDSLSGACPLHNGDNRTQFRVSASKSEPVGNNAAEAGLNKPLGFQLQNLESAHPYLTERELAPETIGEFGLGFCASGSMNGRVVIPIHNPEGQLLAYAGRWPGAPPEDTPKYKLPAGFKKSLELFNLHRAIQAPPEQPLVIVEGYFDCIKLWQLGLRRVGALMGSILSPTQEGLIRKHTNSRSCVLVMLDEDDTGRAGRDEVARRLARFVFVKTHVFDAEGRQPENLNSEEVAALCGGVE